MSEEVEILKAVAHRLDTAGIPYMVTGSMAVNYYAVPRIDPLASPIALRQALFIRFYGHEFDPETREKILLALGKVAGSTQIDH